MAMDESQGSLKAEIDHQEETTCLPPSTPKTNTNNSDASCPQPIGHELSPRPEGDNTESTLIYNNQSTQNPPAMARFIAECDGPWTVFGQAGYPTAEAPLDFGSKTTTVVATQGSASDRGNESYAVPEAGNGNVGSEPVKSVCDGTQHAEDEAGVGRS
ncbi:hypothetical protein BHE90_012973 [Fusarium euwallaceae]|uniref:Uncharacterized protein n=1 Tax=Fusarium euwallaceae TaxID=1147111 RepID=A0A430LAB3_9HYPO|nr:hypothetical protein BHE90_012973 [Fusarium euwallaceae]